MELIDGFSLPGLALGHQSLGDTGVTALVSTSAAGMVAAVDQRGGGPGTRETDLLKPHNTVERVNAIVLAGGSAFGLAAADGAMRELESRGLGFAVFGESNPGPRVPIVPAAVIFDLIIGDPNHRPSPEDGAAAVRAALDGHSGDAVSAVPVGSVGAGCGATAGVLRGGFGVAQARVGDFTVAAAVVANPIGSVIDPDTGRFFGDPARPAVDLDAFAALVRPQPKLNTTIGVVATDCPVGIEKLERLAMTGHDGIARAVRPAHSPLDGDTLFAVSTAEPEAYTGSAAAADPDLYYALCDASARCVEAAIVRGVAAAEPGYGVAAWNEIT
ncbi:P1 family peptidase [Corynebacterium genitalium ATCC 33030]|uniref:Peptidase family T4 n=1 Tax=Corynebacterium genitalium ATCC 33030 TaxID=585529 RepID=D7WBZ5_9CORY|nr:MULTISPECIES: P1 family peptidase [Corynebacterium]EFK54624.1 peptidase family T4 [Corynebacterium genitalium ATCC 33030]MCQ4621397.1 P1 family peptidase [Corynebacterium sp. CCUG 71335]UUA89048.1 P1 family peptidase [Corynebacterium genitalium ATCC 33030]